jgi:murein L,D-transpeptidase YafK
MDNAVRIFSGMLMILTASASFAANETAPAMEASQTETVPAGLVQMPPFSRYYSPYAFVVDKKARTLAVWQQTGSGLKKVASFPADMGANDGPKLSAGDKRTPEGIYFLQRKLEGNAIDFKTYGKRAYTTDYPNYFDKQDGKTGWGIWLHSVPDTVPLTRGSRGCVVVRNDIIVALDQYIRLGRTPMLIQGATDLVTQDVMSKQMSDLAKWLETWRAAWEAKDIDAYMNAYGEDFMSQKMNRDQWRVYKTKLNSNYKTIQVRLSKPIILVDRDRAVARFLQEYTSDQHADFGEKVLFMKKNADGTFRIVGEDWSPETSTIAREEIEATTTTSSTQHSQTTAPIKAAQAN